MLDPTQNFGAATTEIHTIKMQQLGALTNALTTSIPPSGKVGYVDYPMHINVGDLLIFLGAMNFFQWNDNAIPTSFCLYDGKKNAFDSLENVDVIACHGGGNFGDIYPHHQNLREKIVQAFPHKPIVIMPQSMHFNSEEAMHKSADIFKAHDNVTIYMRDEESFIIARKYFSDKVFLCPDMAHRLYNEFSGIRASAKPLNNKLALMRTDVEAALDSASTQLVGKDWKNIMRLEEKLRIERHRLATRLAGGLNRPSPDILPAYHQTIKEVVSAIATRIGGHNPWITSRLHGAILGLLLDRQVTLVDNSYGKNSRYFSAWGADMVHMN